MRVASIDIGTNTILLLIADVRKGLSEILDISESPRLGQDLAARGQLGKEAIERAIRVLKDYKKLIEKHGVEKTFCFGTAALREARNAMDFVRLVEESFDFEVEILSEEYEAYYSFLSIVMDPLFGHNEKIIIDIGAGSVEIIQINNQAMENFTSLPLGVLKLKELFLKNDPPNEKELSLLSTHVENVLKVAKPRIKGNIAGIGGTITNVASILTGKNYFDKNSVHGMKISKEVLQSLLNKMKGLSTETIKEKFPSIEKKRADIIMPGIVLLEKIVDSFGSNYIKVSIRGARYGIIYDRIGFVPQASRDLL
ncbi:MAG: Ppx/GppA family phosphatase [Deltaproteobacteria bacterium]|nr:Ppx/GppA family phosphatase [Deltaproteobacteria bacterium]